MPKPRASPPLDVSDDKDEDFSPVDRPIPWIGWSGYTSTDTNNPDKLQIKIVETETFETEYSTAVKVMVKRETRWLFYFLPLKSNNSSNDKLLRLWAKNVKNGRLKPGVIFTLATYKRPSKRSKWMIREFDMVF